MAIQANNLTNLSKSLDLTNITLTDFFLNQSNNILTDNFSNLDMINFDISRLSMNHFFPNPIKIKKTDFIDNGLNFSQKTQESEPKLSDFSQYGEEEQQKAKDLLKVKVNSDFNNFDGNFYIFNLLREIY